MKLNLIVRSDYHRKRAAGRCVRCGKERDGLKACCEGCLRRLAAKRKEGKS